MNFQPGDKVKHHIYGSGIFIENLDCNEAAVIFRAYDGCEIVTCVNLEFAGVTRQELIDLIGEVSDIADHSRMSQALAKSIDDVKFRLLIEKGKDNV